MTTTLAVVTLAAYLIQHVHPSGVQGAIDQWGLNPVLITGGGVLPSGRLPAWIGLLTAAFLHSTWTHLGANMGILMVLGTGLEQVLGGQRFLVLYLLSAVLGNLGIVLVLPGADVFACGASVAVAGIWAAWLALSRVSLRRTLLLLDPHAPILRIIRIVISAVVVLTILAAAWGWFGFKLIALFTGAGLRVFWSIGFCGHLFGAVTGVLIAIVLTFTALKRRPVRH